MSKRTPKAASVTIQLSADDLNRVKAMAARSEYTLERWLQLAVTSAAYVDEAHWAEMAEREAIQKEIGADRGRFARLALTFRNISDGAFRVLVDELVAERQRGRVEGSESARRLCVVRPS